MNKLVRRVGPGVTLLILVALIATTALIGNALHLPPFQQAAHRSDLLADASVATPHPLPSVPSELLNANRHAPTGGGDTTSVPPSTDTVPPDSTTDPAPTPAATPAPAPSTSPAPSHATQAPKPSAPATTRPPSTTGAPSPATTRAPSPATTSAPPTTPTTAAFTPTGPGGSWRLTFTDDFNNNSLDGSKWVTCYPWDNSGCTNNGNHEDEWYQGQNVQEGNGVAQLSAKKQTVTASDGKTYDYTSGMISTGATDDQSAPKYSFTYGYAEARVMVPAGTGLMSSFWLLPTGLGWPPEIDAFQIAGQTPTQAQMHVISGADVNSEVNTASAWNGPNFSQDYHIFGVDWEPNAITWYIDGVQRAQVTDTSKIPNQPMYALFTLSVGGDQGGAPSSSLSGGQLKIGDMRVWQH